MGSGLGRGASGREGWTIGIEAEHLTVAEKKRLADLLPSGVRLKDAPALVERARMVKDDDELELIRAAVRLGAKLFDRALEVLRPGVKEAEVAAEMEYAARRAGAEEMSFPTIIASGARSALPHGRATEQADRAGRIRGLRLRCYTRRLLFGPDPHCVGGRGFRRKRAQAYEAVREAQQAAIDGGAAGRQRRRSRCGGA